MKKTITMVRLYATLITITLCAMLVSVQAYSQEAGSEQPEKLVTIERSVEEDGQLRMRKRVRYADEPTGDHDRRAKKVDVAVETDGSSTMVRIAYDGEVEVLHFSTAEGIAEEDRDRLAEKGIFLSGEGEQITVRVSEPPTGADGQKRDGEADSSYCSGSLAKHIHHVAETLADIDVDVDIDIERFMKGYHFHHRETRKSACVALGVLVGQGAEGGVRVSSMIDGAGAAEAGIRPGDLITSLGGVTVESYAVLVEALAAYEPGDRVSVSFKRDGEDLEAEVELRAWGELPGYSDSWRADVKCGDTAFTGEFKFLPDPVTDRKIIIIKKNREDTETEDKRVSENATPTARALQLRDFAAFPNPTGGQFRLEFSAEPIPLAVSIFDATGKEVFRDNQTDFAGFYQREIDLRGSAKGPVVVSVVQGDKQYSTQVIIQ